MNEVTKCSKPGCPHEMQVLYAYPEQVFKDLPIPSCPATDDEHRAWASVAKLEAKLAEANRKGLQLCHAFGGALAIIGLMENEIPTNWCDSLLTGAKAVIGKPPYTCADIEKLLLALKRRLSEHAEAARKAEVKS